MIIGDTTLRIELEEPSASGQSSTVESAEHKKPSTQLLSITLKDGVYRARLESGTLRSIDTGKLRVEIASLHHPGKPPAIIMSMRGMDSLASGCIGAIAQLSTDLEQVGGALVLYNLPKEITKMLRKTKLDRLVLTAKNNQQARKKVLAAKKKLSGLPNQRAA